MRTEVTIGIGKRTAVVIGDDGLRIQVYQGTEYSAPVLSEAKINWPGCIARSVAYTANFRYALVEAERIAERWNYAIGTMPEGLTFAAAQARASSW